jgi:hypothetical protein
MFLLTPRFPNICANKTSAALQLVNGATLQHWYIHCADSIIGQCITIEDKDNSNTDIALINLRLGTEHILLGVDHLLFVFALL